MAYSAQGFNIAFIGLNRGAQTACAQYLKRTHGFKRLDMDDALKQFIKTSYWYKTYQNLPQKLRQGFYDSIYRVDPDIFLRYTQRRMRLSSADTVIYDVRYLNELRGLQEMNFIVCRVTTPVKHLQAGRYVKGAEDGTVALSLAYDKRFAVNYNVEHSVNWTSKGTTGAIMDEFLDRIGYKLDI